MPEQFWGDKLFWNHTDGFWAVYASASASSRGDSYVKGARQVSVKTQTSNTVQSYSVLKLTAYVKSDIENKAIGDTESGDIDIFVTGRSTTEQSSQGNCFAYPIIYSSSSSVNIAINDTVNNERYGPAKKTTFWGGAYRSMAYTTSLLIPEQADGASLIVKPVMERGKIRTMEYGRGVIGDFWKDELFWGERPFWKVSETPKSWQTMPNAIQVLKDEMVFVRMTTVDTEPCKICDIEWIFDVPDAEQISLQEFHVPVGGIRIPVPPKHFRWLKTISLTLQYMEGDTSTTAKYIDRGLIVDGFVMDGPLVIVVDQNKNSVSGNIDVLLQGAKGL